MLRQQSSEDALPLVRRNSSPVAATLLSLIVPGLGAAYNGQTSKAVVHFTLFASFFQMATVTQGLTFFVLGVVGTWLFAAVDAGRTAQLLRDGLEPDAAEDVIARRLYGNPLAWSVTLVAIGAIFLLHTMLGVQLPVRQFLPVLLVVLGLYMMGDYIHRRLRRERKSLRFDANRPPPSVIAGAALGASAFGTGEIVTQGSARDAASFPFEPRP
ncbi:MAG: hypothetical protein QOF02_442 [Blastocatellia bacterium]|jgi:hypothetical protein|nr:hypothetical protein [Blastocatellia bacterium]